MTDEEFNDLRNRVTILENLRKFDMFGHPQGPKEIPCLWDGIPETYPGIRVKIAGLVCPCPKCSPRC